MVDKGGAPWRLSDLGHHLGKMPVDARLGRMLIYGAVLGCLHPVLYVFVYTHTSMALYTCICICIYHLWRGARLSGSGVIQKINTGSRHPYVHIHMVLYTCICIRIYAYMCICVHIGLLQRTLCEYGRSFLTCACTSMAQYMFFLAWLSGLDHLHEILKSLFCTPVAYSVE